MIINLDIDHPLFDFVGAFRDFLLMTANYKRVDLPNPTKYKFADEWGMTEEEFSDHFRSFELNGFYRWGYYQLQHSFNFKAWKGDHSLNLVTARGTVRQAAKSQSSAAMGSTIKWLESYSIPHDGLFFTSRKTDVRGDVLIDDCIDHLEAARAIGMRAVCVDAGWNQQWDGERVQCISELKF